MLYILVEKISKSMKASKLRKVLCNITKSYLANYNKMNGVNCQYILKFEALQ